MDDYRIGIEKEMLGEKEEGATDEEWGL